MRTLARARGNVVVGDDAAPNYVTRRAWAVEAIRAGSFDVARDLLRELHAEAPRDHIVLYHLACAESLLRHKDEAFRYVELALKHGFTNHDELLTNPDLHNVRTLPHFAPMVQQYKSALHVLELMRQTSTGVDVRSRTWMLRTFKDCFVGREAVDWLLRNALAESRESAVSLGRELAQRGLIRHVTG